MRSTQQRGAASVEWCAVVVMVAVLVVSVGTVVRAVDLGARPPVDPVAAVGRPLATDGAPQGSGAPSANAATSTPSGPPAPHVPLQRPRGESAPPPRSAPGPASGAASRVGPAIEVVSGAVSHQLRIANPLGDFPRRVADGVRHVMGGARNTVDISARVGATFAMAFGRELTVSLRRIARDMKVSPTELLRALVAPPDRSTSEMIADWRRRIGLLRRQSRDYLRELSRMGGEEAAIRAADDLGRLMGGSAVRVAEWLVGRGVVRAARRVARDAAKGPYGG